LVNLLIAMMGDRYSKLNSNAQKEWKFFRCSLLQESLSANKIPPPFNIVVLPIRFTYEYFLNKDYPEGNNSNMSNYGEFEKRKQKAIRKIEEDLQKNQSPADVGKKIQSNLSNIIHEGKNALSDQLSEILSKQQVHDNELNEIKGILKSLRSTHGADSSSDISLLILLRVNETENVVTVNHGEKAPRMPIGYFDDKGDLKGEAADISDRYEVNISRGDAHDLHKLAIENGASWKEDQKVYVVRLSKSNEDLEKFQNQSGTSDKTINIVEVSQMWKHTDDPKLLRALHLYEALKTKLV